MSELSPEMRKALDDRGDNRMFAYYFGFDATGSDAVNDVLAAVAFAGKAFHSTEQWGDDDSMPFTMVDLIQATANEAAEHIAKVEAERDELRAERGDTLAEMVRLLDRIVQVRAEAGHDRPVADDAEHERCPAGICRRPAGHAGPHSDLPREGER